MSDKLTLQLEAKKDGDDRTYYIAKLKGPVLIDCKDGVAFLIFTSIEGEEEIQICNYLPPKNNGKYKEMPHKKYEENND
jgi:hypothetical protein